MAMRFFVWFFCLAGWSCGAALAQDYPAKTVRVIVPWAAGGSTDSVARILAAKLTENLGQQFIIDNRSGATGTIGTLQASKSPPDGYTLLFGTNSTFAIAPHLYKLPYDNDTALAPISLLAVSPQILTVHPSLPVRNVRELIALAKAKPDSLFYSTAGPGSTSHLATELLMSMAGIKMTHVPYRGGSGPSAQALISGETGLSFVNVIIALPFSKAGRLRPLAASTARRAEMMPDLPTMSEAGLKGYESSTSFAAFAPAGTSRDIVGRLNKEFTRVLTSPDVKKKLAEQGIDAIGGSPEEFAAYSKVETAKWGKLIKEQGIKFE
jgi:tripartite-type tricarboxylate transporter receptor subunit TctC